MKEKMTRWKKNWTQRKDEGDELDERKTGRGESRKSKDDGETSDSYSTVRQRLCIQPRTVEVLIGKSYLDQLFSVKRQHFRSVFTGK